MRARTPLKLRAHVLWALVVLFVVFLHLRGRSLEHAAATGPRLIALHADSARLPVDGSAANSDQQASKVPGRRHIIAFVGVQVRSMCRTAPCT